MHTQPPHDASSHPQTAWGHSVYLYDRSSLRPTGPRSALATRRGLTYVALPGPRLVVYATFAAHAPVRAVGDRVAALARGLERASARLFAEPFLY